MKKTEDPLSPPIDLTLHFEAPQWKEALPGIDDLCPQVICEVLDYLNYRNLHIELSLVLADDAFVQQYNKQFRGIDRPTNVLSFSALARPRIINKEENLGDILMAFSTVEREAQEQGKTLEAHFIHLLVHGILHLIGYNHETDTQADEMEEIETQILAKFGLNNPYNLNTKVIK